MVDGELASKKERHILVHCSNTRVLLHFRHGSIVAVERVIERTPVGGQDWKFDALELCHCKPFKRKAARCRPETKLEWAFEIQWLNNIAREEYIIADQSTNKSARCGNVCNKANEGLSKERVDCDIQGEEEEEICKLRE